MQLDVNKLINQGEGAQADYKISAETPTLEGIALAEPISGEITVIGMKDGVMVTGKLQAGIALECDRCLRTFTHHLEFPIEAEFSSQPEEDQFKIDKYGSISLDESVRQEIEIHTPLRRLCQEDCSGIELKQKKDS